MLYAFLLRPFPFFVFFLFLVKFYLPKPVKRGQTQAPAWFNTSESHSWGWVRRLSPESITDFGMLWGRRQYHKWRARCWGCERQAWSSAWVNLNGGSAREAFGDLLSFLLTTTPPPPPHAARPPPPPLSFASSWPRNKDSKHPQTPTMLCSAHFPTAHRRRIITNIKMEKRCREAKVENTVWWRDRAVLLC